MSTYTTRTEAIQREIIDPINSGDANATEFNIDAIADEVIDCENGAYYCTVDPDEFWEVVE